MAWINRNNSQVRVKLKRNRFADATLSTCCSTIGCYTWFKPLEPFQEQCPKCLGVKK